MKFPVFTTLSIMIYLCKYILFLEYLSFTNAFLIPPLQLQTKINSINNNIIISPHNHILPVSPLSPFSLYITPNRNEEQELKFDEIPSQFTPLFTQTVLTTIPREQDDTANAHEKFRFEWGSWVNETQILTLMDRIDEVQIAPGGALNALATEFYDQKLDSSSSPKTSLRYSIASGKNWNILLHILPPNIQYEGSWPTGSWTIVKALTGVVELAMLREDRDGNYKKSSKKDLRGGSDGSLFGGGGGGSSTTSGQKCIKYVGGALRSYMGKSNNISVMIEVVVKPPITVETDEVIEQLDGDLCKYISIYIPPTPTPSDPQKDQAYNSPGSNSIEEQPTAKQQAQNLSAKMGMNFDKVGGLDNQLDAIVRRVLASRANPKAAKRLGISHVRGILLSGPPGCGKTLLARELARLLGAREPQIVNGPEILDKFIGEAERRVRDLFIPAEMEYAQVGDDSALHIIILDEMDAIARKRGSVSSDTTGVRDSVVNQLLAKMDGVREANNVLVVGLTNRPELIDPALLRPGRLEVQLRVELPDLQGRRDILRIHTRKMKEAGALSKAALSALEDLSERGLPAKTEHFSGAELAGLVRSAASFALARSVQQQADSTDDEGDGIVDIDDLKQALKEVRPALGKQDEVLKSRFPMGISSYSSSMSRILRDLKRFTLPSSSNHVHSMLLVGSGNGGSGVTALAAWAAAHSSSDGSADFVRFITALDLLTAGSGDGGDLVRASALVDRFSEAREMSQSLIVLDDIDQLCAGSGTAGYSNIMIGTLRALLRTPPESTSIAKAGGHSTTNKTGQKTMKVIATTSRSDAACRVLHELFEETIVVPYLSSASEVKKLLDDTGIIQDTETASRRIIDRLNSVGCKTVLRVVERALVTSGNISIEDASSPSSNERQLTALEEILEDLSNDEATTSNLCNVY